VSQWRAGGPKDAKVSNGSEAIVRNEFPLARSLGTSEGLELGRAESRRPIRSITWCGMAVWTVRAEPAKLIRSHAMRCAPLMQVADPVAGLLLLRATLMLPPRGIKADAWPPGEPRIPPLPVMPHRGQVESVRAGLLEPRHRIHRSPAGGTRVTLQRLPSGVRKANQDRALWSLARLSKALYDKLMPMNSDPSLLRAALVGYENQLQKIDQAISDLRQRLHLAPARASQPASGRRRTLSAGARRRIAAAQKKRWAAYRKSKGAGK